MPPNFCMARSGSNDQLSGTRLVVVVTSGRRRLERQWPLVATKQVSGGSWWFARAQDVERWNQNGPDFDDLPAEHEELVHSRTNSPAERQGDASIPFQSSSRLHQSRDGDRTGRSTYPPNHRDPIVESCVVKRRVGSASLTALEVRFAAAKKTKELSGQVKGSFATSTTDIKVNKSSPAGDKKQRELIFHPLKKRVVFVVETIWHSSAVATSSATDLVSRKDAYFHLELKNADISLSYDKLLTRFGSYHKSAEKSKFKAIIDAYELGCLDCTNGYTPFYVIGDVNALDTEGAEEQKPEEVVVEKDGAEEDAFNEMMVDVEEKVGRAAESVANLVDAEEAADHGSPAGVSE
ncbi:hypothetical protein L3X38_026141 [Prunus dulcis]|uniref:Uncharacterized protein n=1 Tax=Prunus dulcis TaxID=3755 RepID=A0AAD4Z730_PRUDU|nr:hypothetical protein L3X38_026141 [Prunus dulcis]